MNSNPHSRWRPFLIRLALLVATYLLFLLMRRWMADARTVELLMSGQARGLFDLTAVISFLVLRLLTALLLPPLCLSWCVDLLWPRPATIISPIVD